MRPLAILVCGLLGGCFDEGEQQHRQDAARVMVESLASFADIQANLTTDPARAGDALVKFVRTPVAAHALLAPPFEPSGTSARTVPPPDPVPDCLTTSGATGCDGFVTHATCNAGPFSFSGSGNRTCSPCAAVTGRCSYDWDLVLDYAAGGTSEHMNTLAQGGGMVVDGGMLTADTTFDFQLTDESYTVVDNLRVCTCGPLDLTSGTAVSSSFVVKAFAGSGCARVTFDAAGGVALTDDCVCADGNTCQ